MSEYGFEVPEGLHRCTTNTTTWSVKPSAPLQIHSQLTSDCNASSSVSSECRRDLHVYLLEDINVILAVADPKCDACFEQPYKDGPVEGGWEREEAMHDRCAGVPAVGTTVHLHYVL